MAALIKKVTLVTEAVCCLVALEDVELKMVTMATQGEVVAALRQVDVVIRILVAAKELVARVVKVLPLVSLVQAHNDGFIALMITVKSNMSQSQFIIFIQSQEPLVVDPIKIISMVDLVAAEDQMVPVGEVVVVEDTQGVLVDPVLIPAVEVVVRSILVVIN